MLKRLYSFVFSLVFILHLHVFNVPPSFATNSKQKRILALFNQRRQRFFYCFVVIFKFNHDSSLSTKIIERWKYLSFNNLRIF